MRLKDHISSGSLLRKLGINNIQTLLRYNRLCWFGHVVRNDGCINSITEFEVVGQRGRGRPKKTWKDTINNDLRHWKLSRADPANRMEWRKKLRTNIGAVRPTLSGTDTLNEMMMMMMKGAFQVFHDSPAKRADYLIVTGSDLFPLFFCATRWVEDKKVSDRLLEIWPHISRT